MNNEPIQSKNGFGTVNVILPDAISNVYGVTNTKTLRMPADNSIRFVPLQRAHDESVLLSITRVLENAWKHGTDVAALMLNPKEFKMLQDQTCVPKPSAEITSDAHKQKVMESTCVRLYTGTLHCMFGMKVEQGPQDVESIAILGDRKEFDYEAFKSKINK